MHVKITLIALIIIFYTSCRSNNGQFNKDTSNLNEDAVMDSLVSESKTDSLRDIKQLAFKVPIFSIDYENALKVKKYLTIDDIASQVRYIPLETDSTCLIGINPVYYFSNDLIFVSDINHVLVFDFNGNFIRKIGNEGKGPNEINRIKTVSIIKDNKIIAIHTYVDMKLLLYSFNGDFLESIDVPLMNHIYVLNSNKFIYYDLCIGGIEDYVFRLTNRKNDTLNFVSNDFKWVNNTYTQYEFFSTNFHPSYHYKNKFFFKNRYNDTIFTVINSKIVPAYCIQLGKYKVPEQMRLENPATYNQFMKNSEKYYYTYSLECDSLIFISANNYTGKDLHHVLYETYSGNSFQLVNKNNLNSGIQNNWDSGPEFWPEGSVNDNEVFMSITPGDLFSLINESHFMNSNPHHLDKKNEFLELVEGLNETDNPVIMIVTLK
jgi:hypothetical protein